MHVHPTDHGPNGQANGPPVAAVLDGDPMADGGAASGHHPGHGQAADCAPVLIVNIGGHATELDASMLDDPTTVQDLRDACTQADGPVIFEVADLLGWPDGPRWTLLRLVAGIGPHARLGLGGSFEHANVFDAVLTTLVGDEDVARCERGRRAAIEAAVLAHPDALPAACSRIARRFKELGVAGVRADGLARQARELVEGLAGEPGGDQFIPIRSVLPDAPVPDEAVVPVGWSLAINAVQQMGRPGAPSIPAPVVIAARLKDEAEGTESLRLAWRRDGQWKQHVVERVVACVARSVVELAALGLPVTSNNAAALVQYLADFEEANLEVLPVARVARQMGWLGEGGSGGFLWGREHLVEGVGPVVCPPGPASVPAPATSITFRGADAGDEQLADGFHSGGTFDGWRQAVGPAEKFPRVVLGICAGLVPPLLAVLDSPNFVVDFSGPTSEGKTTTLRVATSPWGRPDERSPAAAMSTWDSSRVWIERASAVLNNIPLILDDTKRASRRKDVAQTLYDVASGRGRGRGSPKGMARSGTWTTVLLSSGEAPATSFTEDGGTRARVLTVWGSPFGQANKATAQVVQQLDLGVRAHYGHAGPRFVRHLLDHRGDWPCWRDEYRALLHGYVAKAGNDPVVGRMAAHFAALVLTTRLAHQADILPWAYRDPVELLWDDLIAGTPEADVATRALKYVVSWAYGHQQEFFKRRDVGDGQPHGGWVGRWDREKKETEEPWPYIGFLPHRLDEVLAEGGFEREPVQRTWKDRNWLLLDSEGRPRRKARIDEESSWLVAIRRSAVDVVEGVEEDDAP